MLGAEPPASEIFHRPGGSGGLHPLGPHHLKTRGCYTQQGGRGTSAAFSCPCTQHVDPRQDIHGADLYRMQVTYSGGIMRFSSVDTHVASNARTWSHGCQGPATSVAGNQGAPLISARGMRGESGVFFVLVQHAAHFLREGNTRNVQWETLGANDEPGKGWCQTGHVLCFLQSRVKAGTVQENPGLPIVFHVDVVTVRADCREFGDVSVERLIHLSGATPIAGLTFEAAPGRQLAAVLHPRLFPQGFSMTTALSWCQSCSADSIEKSIKVSESAIDSESVPLRPGVLQWIFSHKRSFGGRSCRSSVNVKPFKDHNIIVRRLFPESRVPSAVRLDCQTMRRIQQDVHRLESPSAPRESV